VNSNPFAASEDLRTTGDDDPGVTVREFVPAAPMMALVVMVGESIGAKLAGLMLAA
jgi:hypothetical protein